MDVDRRTVLAWAGAAMSAPLRGQLTAKPPVMARDWAAATGHPQAAAAAASVLEQGGNAIDAAVAATFAACVVQPANTGVGGHGMVMIRLAKTGEVRCIDGSGWSGRNAVPARFDPARGGLPLDGPLAPVVPGLVSALLKASGQYGRLPRARLLEPAIRLAAEGFVVTPYLEDQLRQVRDRMLRYEGTRRLWYPGGEPLNAGTLVRQPGLAATLRAIARNGAVGFYRGPAARHAVADLKRHGGLLEESDFAEYSAREGPAMSVDYRGYRVYDGPAWSFDHIALESLNILEGFDIRAMGAGSPAFIHHVTEAMKLAFADRDWTVEDPRFPAGMASILTREFAAGRRRLLDPRRALDPAPHGEIKPGGNTDYVGVIDRDRNLVSITSSVSGAFGNMSYVEEAGFFLNNWMPLFKLAPGDANVLQPRKVPRTGWSPMLALRGGKPFAVFGTPGGDTIPQAQLQFFLNVACFDMNVQEALEQPWFRTEAFRAYRYPNEVGKNLVLSDRIPVSTRQELAAMGHVLTSHGLPGIGSVRAVLIDPRTGTLAAGSAPGRDESSTGR